MNARPGDTLRTVTCRCGAQLVDAWGVADWRCTTCKRPGTVGQTWRLLDVSTVDLTARRGGWEAA